LIVEYKWGERNPDSKYVRNSGILLHGVGPDGSQDGVWMTSIECQLAQGCEGDLILIRGKTAEGERFPATIKGAFVLRSADPDPHAAKVLRAEVVRIPTGPTKPVPMTDTQVEVAPRRDLFLPFEVTIVTNVTTVADLRFAKPLDEELIRRLLTTHEVAVTVEEASIGGLGGFGDFFTISTACTTPVGRAR
jgi:hypothetical protein